MSPVPPVSVEDCEYHHTPSGNSAGNGVEVRTQISTDDNNDCAEKQRQSAEGGNSSFIKDKRDLNAQEGVWRATNLVGFLTVIATLLAFVGVVFLYRTMTATGKTLNAASRTADATENAERAHLFFEPKPSYSNKKMSIVINPRVKNFGRSPATNVHCGIAIDRFGGSIDLLRNSGVISLRRPDEEFSNRIVAAGKKTRFDQIHVGFSETYIPRLNPHTGVEVPVITIVSDIKYTDVFGINRFVVAQTTIRPMSAPNRPRINDRFIGEPAPTQDYVEMILSLLDTFDIETTVIGEGAFNRTEQQQAGKQERQNDSPFLEFIGWLKKRISTRPQSMLDN